MDVLLVSDGKRESLLINFHGHKDWLEGVTRVSKGSEGKGRGNENKMDGRGGEDESQGAIH